MWSLALHRGTWRRAILRCKENYDPRLAQSLAQLLLENLPVSQKFEAVVPAPTSQRRLKWRGYHAPRLVSEGLARQLSVPCIDCLTLVGDPVARKLLRHRHREAPRMQVHGTLPQRVLLLDDVVTSGQTLLQATQRLKQAGAQEVFACTLAASIDKQS